MQAATRRLDLRRAGAIALALAPLLALGCGDDVAPGTDTEGASTDTTESGDTTAGPGGSSSSETTLDTGGSDSETASSSSGGPTTCDGLSIAERDFIGPGGGAVEATLERCEHDRWYFAAPKGSTYELTLTAGAATPTVEAAVDYPDGAPAADPDPVFTSGLLAPFASQGGAPTSRLFEAPRSGEFAIHVRADDPEASADYSLSVTCVEGCELETTRFPIVLVHGWTGFDNIGPLDYFYQVPDHLTAAGFPVHVSQTDPYNSSEVRSMQLADQVDEVLASWRARKVDLIGHSQGGIDSRALISTLEYGDRVAVLTTIATPHRGTYITDLALGLVPGPGQQAAFFLFNFLGAVSADAQSDAEASFLTLSETYMMEEFNPANPDDPRVQYISYTGRTCSADEFLNPQNECQDLIDPLLSWSQGILRFARGDNDGLVTVESAKWGEYRGEMVADHIDEVGHLFGITDPDFDHTQFYLERAQELADELH